MAKITDKTTVKLNDGKTLSVPALCFNQGEVESFLSDNPSTEIKVGFPKWKGADMSGKPSTVKSAADVADMIAGAGADVDVNPRLSRAPV